MSGWMKVSTIKYDLVSLNEFNKYINYRVHVNRNTIYFVKMQSKCSNMNYIGVFANLIDMANFHQVRLLFRWQNWEWKLNKYK